MEADILSIEETIIAVTKELEKHDIRLEFTREKTIEVLISLICAKDLIGEMEQRIARNSFITPRDLKKILDGIKK